MVHCSAGVGRTGTFITILRALHRMPFMHCMNDLSLMIDETIVHLRRRRLWMVKTDGEYATIFCVLWHRLHTYGIDRPIWADSSNCISSSSDGYLNTSSSRESTGAASLAAASKNHEDVNNYRGVGFTTTKA